MALRGLDAYITGGRYQRDEVERTCKKCECTWTVQGFTEYGGFFADNDDDFNCPQCGTESEDD